MMNLWLSFVRRHNLFEIVVVNSKFVVEGIKQSIAAVVASSQ